MYKGWQQMSLDKVKHWLLAKQHTVFCSKVQEVARCSKIQIHYINTESVYNTMVSVSLHGGKQMVPKTWKLKRARVVDFANNFFGS